MIVDFTQQSNGDAKGKNIKNGIPFKAALHTKTIIAIAGGKGGVGKTLVTAGMGVALAEMDKKIVAVDVDFSGANLHQALGIISPPLTLADFIFKRQKDINKLAIETSIPNLHLIAGDAGTPGIGNLKYWVKKKVLRHLRNIDADVVLLDIGAGNAFNQLDYFNFADHGIIIITPEPMAIQDGYNFIKVSLFRKIYNIFSHYSELRNTIRTYFSRVDEHTPMLKDFRKTVEKAGSIAVQKYDRLLENFRPNLIVNMIEDQGDYKESLAIQIAVRDILNIDFDQIHFVRYDDKIRRAAKMMRPDLLMSMDIDAAADIRRSAKGLVFGQTESIPDAPASLKAEKESIDSGQLDKVICSMRCSLWGNCSAQNGGLACRIPVVGYMNQK